MGYITLPGGHRVGVAGQAVIELGVVRAWRHISSINFRVARSVVGCADGVLPYVYEAIGVVGDKQLCLPSNTKAVFPELDKASKSRIYHTMIISPPGGGKTTLLRDMVRQISDGGPVRYSALQTSDDSASHVEHIAGGIKSSAPNWEGLTVGLVDERSEVAGCFMGVPQNDVGIRTDVLDGCPKAEGMVMLLRAMSPDVIAVDELGGKGDAEAVETVLTAGVRLLCTAHGNSLDDIRKNPALAGLVNRGVFQRYIVLSAPGRAAMILDGDGKLL